MASSKAAKRKATFSCDDGSKKESLSGPLERKKTRFKNKKRQTNELDEISLQLEQEKRRALEILSSLCSTDAHISSDEEHQAINVPCQEITSEVVSVACKTTPKKVTFNEGGVACRTTPKEEDVASQTTPTPESDTMECHEEDEKQMGSSFSVNADLKQLFSATCGGGGEIGGGFNFLTDEQTGNNSNEASPKARPCENQEPSISNTCTTDTLDGEEVEVTDIDVPKYFFFHCGNESLRNRIDENVFYRTEALEDLEAEWPARREAMKQSFRRRHKDALKQTRKK